MQANHPYGVDRSRGFCLRFPDGMQGRPLLPVWVPTDEKQSLRDRGAGATACTMASVSRLACYLLVADHLRQSQLCCPSIMCWLPPPVSRFGHSLVRNSFMLLMQAPALRLARELSTPLCSRTRLGQVWVPFCHSCAKHLHVIACCMGGPGASEQEHYRSTSAL